MKYKPLLKSHSSLEISITQERLRQAHHSFNAALIANTACFLISLLGIGLLFSNKISEGTVIAGGGLVSSIQCIQLAKDANNRLDEILSMLIETQN